MRKSVRFLAWTLAISLLVLSPALAGKGGNDGNDPDPKSKGGAGWNPTFSCEVQIGDTWLDFMECLADGIQDPPDPGPSPPGGREDYVVYPLSATPPPFGIQIWYQDGSEIDRLYWWEDDPNIKMNFITVNQPGLVGRIAAVSERPSRMGGLIKLEVNGTQLPAAGIPTGLYNKASKLTDEILVQIRRHFHAIVIDDYIYITQESSTGAGITSITWESTDPSIVSTDLALLPGDEMPLTQTPQD
jgi:hypothetical protein